MRILQQTPRTHIRQFIHFNIDGWYLYYNILLNNVARVDSTQEQVGLVFAAATLATVEGPVEPPVVHDLPVHAQLQTDALAGSNIPAEKCSDLGWGQ